MNKINFKKLSLENKKQLESYTKNFLPYSDFSFLSMFTYNTNQSMEYGFLNENLIVKFEDYNTNQNFFSFLGYHKIMGTVDSLFSLSLSNNLKPVLNLVPSFAVSKYSGLKIKYKVEEDRDNFDYIVSCSKIAKLSHHEFPRKRTLVDKFTESYPRHSVKALDLKNIKTQKEILGLFGEWKVQSHRDEEEVVTEHTAIERLLEHSHNFEGLLGVGIYDQGHLIGFNTFEISTHGYGISSFQKAHRDYIGLYAYLTQQMALTLVNHNCKYINFEQDLGNDGLRSSKLSWHPVRYLKKYTVSIKD